MPPEEELDFDALFERTCRDVATCNLADAFDPVTGVLIDPVKMPKGLQRMLGGKAKVVDRIFFSRGRGHLVGREVQMVLPTEKDRIAAMSQLQKMRAKQGPVKKKETEVEMAARLAKELDSIGMKAVNK